MQNILFGTGCNDPTRMEYGTHFSYLCNDSFEYLFTKYKMTPTFEYE